MLNVKPVKKGTTTRMSFGKIEEVMEMPNLIEVQKNSYKWFLDTGLKEVFRDIAEITDYTGNWVLTFIDYRIDEKTKHTVQECYLCSPHARHCASAQQGDGCNKGVRGFYG